MNPRAMSDLSAAFHPSLWPFDRLSYPSHGEENRTDDGREQ
jgi:hypothetical protein